MALYGTRLAIVAMVACLCIAEFLFTVQARAQPEPSASQTVTNPSPGSDSTAGRMFRPNLTTVDTGPPYRTYKTPFEFYLTLLTIGLAVFLAIVLSVMAWKSGINEDYVRSFMVIVIVFAALFLVVAGYSDEQTAPVFGLLGTIAGYIFGRLGSQAQESKTGANAEVQQQEVHAAGDRNDGP